MKTVTLEKTELELVKEENEKLKRQLRLLRKKVSRARRREEALVEEIEELDTFEPEITVEAVRPEVETKNECSKCGSEMEFFEMAGSIWIMCKNKNCLHRVKVS